MEVRINVMSMISAILLVQGIFVGTSLLFRKVANKEANQIFSAFIIIFALTSINDFAYESGLLHYYPFIESFSSPLYFLLSPLLYLYLVSLTEGRVLWSRQWLHFVPATLLLFIESILAFAGNSDQLHNIEDLYTNDASYFSNLGTVILSLYSSVYWVFCILQLRMKIKIEELESYGYKASEMKFLRNVLYGLTAFWLIWSISVFTSSYVIHAIGQVTAVLYTYALAYYYIVAPNIETNYTIAQNDQTSASVTTPRYEKSVLSEDRAMLYKSKLLEIMKADRPYLDPDLSLGQLASMIDAPPYHLSQVLNVYFGQSFFDFVNSYRIEEIKKNLSDKRKGHLTLLSIGLDAGFNSKGAFNQAFKKGVGETPSSYRKKIIEKSAREAK